MAVEKLKSKAAETRILLVIFAVLAAFKVVYATRIRSFSVDGSYYLGIAQNIRDGLGPVTNVSLYHQGFSYFPHESPVSPIWPWCLGLVAKAVPLQTTAVLLPTLLYFVMLCGAYQFGKRWQPDSVASGVRSFHGGHLFVVLLGGHREIFMFTSLPYTEALAYAVLFWGALRVSPWFDRPTFRGALELGLFFSLLVLIRAQLIFVVMSYCAFRTISLLFSAASQRAAIAKEIVVVGTVHSTMLLSYYWLYLRDFVDAGPFAAIFRFEQARENALLSTPHYLHSKSVFDSIFDFLRGFGEAFNPLGQYTYQGSYALFYLVVPISLWIYLRTPRKPRPIALLRTTAPSRTFFVILACMGFLMVHALHGSMFVEWYFWRRHGVTAVFLFFLLFCWLAAQSDGARRIATAVLAISMIATALGFYRVVNLQVAPDFASYTETSPKLRARLGCTDRAVPISKIVAMTPDPQRIGYLCRNIGFHWIGPNTTEDDLRVLVDHFQTTELLLHGEFQSWPLFQSSFFVQSFERLDSFDGIARFALRPPSRTE